MDGRVSVGRLAYPVGESVLVEAEHLIRLQIILFSIRLSHRLTLSIIRVVAKPEAFLLLVKSTTDSYANPTPP
jgi:hypothetical protein